ncbi:MAG: nuclear transport factor 2 family protein [Bacteroidia bacterium]|nr:nuclear transport factor 2 family protein [Bacteroidia bacterium]
MTKKLTFLLICSFFFGFVEPSTGQNISAQQKTRIEQQVDSLFHSNINAAEHLDYDQLSQSVDDKYKAGFISNGTYFAQYDSLFNIVKTGFQRVAKQTINVRKEKITVLSERIVLITANGDSNVELNDGNTFTAKFFWTFVYEKTGNVWKVIQSHQSSVR